MQLEAVVSNIREFGLEDSSMPFRAVAVEIRVVRTHVHRDIITAGSPNHIDPEKWHPLITSFRHYFGLGPRLHASRFSQVPELVASRDRFRPASDASSSNCMQSNLV